MAQVPEAIGVDYGNEADGLVFATLHLDAFLLNLLRMQFRRDQVQRYPGCRHMYYAPGVREGHEFDDPDSMRIDLWSQWNPSRVDDRPAVLIRRGQAGSTKLAIGDRHQTPLPVESKYDAKYTRAWAGSTTIWCLAKLEIESAMLAAYIGDYLQGFAPHIARGLNIHRLEVRSVSDTKPLREQPSFLATAVVIEYGFLLTWHTQSAASRLNRVIPFES